MSRILHLSDLHLGNTVKEDEVGDYKIEAINESDRVTRVVHMKTTLKALGRRLDSRGEKLDAVVVTGDVTTRGRADGFDRLPDVLKELGEALPSPDRIVIVPGNHDVAWFTAPGSPERYENFVKKVRPLGYVTPLLDGVDYTSSGAAKSTRRPFVEGDDFVIIAVNSADMCGVLERFSSDAEKNLDTLTKAGEINAELAREIHQVRTYDMPRLTPRQISALGDVVHGLRNPSKVLFVAMHHHLLPVTAEEEAKAFESFANLGTVLGFLGAAHVDVVLHGHKHVEGIMPLALRNDDQGVYEAVVASCGTIGGMQGVDHEIAKLIEVDSSLPTLRSVTVSSVHVPSGSTLKLPDKCVVRKSTTHVRRTTVPHARTVSGQTVSDVHEQLIEIANGSENHVDEALLCTIIDGSTAGAPPATYPWPDEVEDREIWFTELVDWWQDSQFAPGKPFTHGQRLRNYGKNSDQIVHAVEALRNADTTRAVAVLIDPIEDFPTKEGQATRKEFPSFSLVQFQIRGQKLDCVAYFRKQEMRYWWPINVAELAGLQAEVVQSLASDTLSAGSITTFTNVAVFSGKVPKVNVPEIDRVAWRDENELRALAMSVIDPRAPGRKANLGKLKGYLLDWIPTSPQSPTDGAPVPARGIKIVADFLEAACVAYPSRKDKLDDLVDALGQLDDVAQAYIKDRADENKPAAETYKALKAKLARRGPKVGRLFDDLVDKQAGSK